MKNLIIGLAGMGHTGKTTLANRLIQEHGFVRVSFAEPLRQMLYTLGVTEEETRDEVLKHTPHPALEGKTPVEALETLGTAWGRNMIGPDIWVNHALAIAKQLDRVIFDDVRYQNEVDAIYNAVGFVFRLWDPDMQPKRPSDEFVARLENCMDLAPRSDSSFEAIVQLLINDAPLHLQGVVKQGYDSDGGVERF
jgi:hypothetical protein